MICPKLTLKLVFEHSIHQFIAMSSQTVAEFNAKVAASPELQERLRSVTSPVELMAFAHEQGYPLTAEHLRELAQHAYEQWVTQLTGPLRSFMEQAQSVEPLNQALKQCRTPVDVITLGQSAGFTLTETDLQQAAIVAESIPGFSFEKLWFRGLGLLP